MDLWRTLAAERPADFNGYLAGTLTILSNKLSDVDKTEEALTAVQEAADLHRTLAVESPALFNADLA